MNSIDDSQRVEEQLRYFSELVGVCPSVQDQRIEELLEGCALNQVRDTLAGVLSEGYKRRLTLAMALVGNTKVVILDDPLAGVDPFT